MISVSALLDRSARRLVGRIEQLEVRLQDGDEAAWPPYVEAVKALAVVVGQLAPERSGRLLTTKELAERLNISPKTLLKRRTKGLITPAQVLGQRGRAALRWRGDGVAVRGYQPHQGRGQRRRDAELRAVLPRRLPSGVGGGA